MRLLLDLLALVRVLSADRARLALENVVLRQQLNVLRGYRSALIASDPRSRGGVRLSHPLEQEQTRGIRGRLV